MRIEFTPEQEKLREEIRRYYRELFTPELRAAFEAERPETGGPVFREIVATRPIARARRSRSSR
jgi:hypothetical protein